MEQVYQPRVLLECAHFASSDRRISKNAGFCQKSIMSELHLAAFQGQLSDVVVLVNARNIDLQTDPGGWTPLRAAVSWDHWKVVHSLLWLGADWRLRDHEGKTAHEVAEMLQHRNTAERLQSCTNLLVAVCAWLESREGLLTGHPLAEPRLLNFVAKFVLFE